MYCKHCGKKLEYDINNDTYAIYNGDIYCSTDCMLFDVDYGGVDVSSFNKEDWDSSMTVLSACANDFFGDSCQKGNTLIQGMFSYFVIREFFCWSEMQKKNMEILRGLSRYVSKQLFIFVMI